VLNSLPLHGSSHLIFQNVDIQAQCGSQLLHAFVAGQVNGRWGKAIRVPGLAALDKGTSQPFAQVTFYLVVSCAPAGPRTAGGSYTDASNHAQGYLTQTR
jgi:hypothetical protein